MTEYHGVLYQWQPSLRDFPDVGSMPHYYVYLFMHVCADYAAQGIHEQVSNPREWGMIAEHVKEMDKIERANRSAPIHHGGYDTVNNAYKQAIRKIAFGREHQIVWEDRTGDNAEREVMPGTNMQCGGLMVVIDRKDYLSITMPPRHGDDGHIDTKHPHRNGSSYMLMLGRNIVIELNGKPMFSTPYESDAHAKNIISRLAERLDIDLQAQLQGRGTANIATSMWRLFPKGHTEYTGGHLNHLIHLLCRQHYYDDEGVNYKDGTKWSGIPYTHEWDAQALVVFNSWVMFLRLHQSKKTPEDYIPKLDSWLMEMRQRVLEHGAMEIDVTIKLENEDMRATSRAISDVLQQVAEDVACAGDSTMLTDTVYLYLLILKP